MKMHQIFDEAPIKLNRIRFLILLHLVLAWKRSWFMFMYLNQVIS